MIAAHLEEPAVLDRLPPVRGRLIPHAALADLIWFRTGGPAEVLFEPADAEDLIAFVRGLPLTVRLMPLGLGSNMIVRDGGVSGVVVRLGKAFADIELDGDRLRCGAGAPGIAVASAARDAGLSGLEFLRGIPGTVGGAIRMNAGAYGREVADCLVDARILLRSGDVTVWPAEKFRYGYRHAELPDQAIVLEGVFLGQRADRIAIAAEMDRIVAEREASQPLRTRTGGSTFKNPVPDRAWELIDRAGCRGLRRGGAQVSEKHCNFLINTGNANAADLEDLGEDVRARVKAATGVDLQWEIDRVGTRGRR